MFSIDALIDILKQQRGSAEVLNLSAVRTGEGIEVTGLTADGKPFRIVAPIVRRKQADRVTPS